MKKIWGCLLFSFVFNVALAQTREQDSLNRLLAVAKEDTGKVKLLVRLSFLDGSFGHGLQLAQDGLALARKLKYSRGEADCLHQLGNQFRAADNYTLALQNFLASLKIREQLDDPEGYSRSLGAIGVVYQKQGDYSLALSYSRRAMAIQKKFNYNSRLAYTSSSVGEMFEEMNRLDSALLYFQNSYAYFNAEPDKYQMAKALNGLGRVQLKMGNKELALSYYRLATVNAIAFNDSSKLVNNYLGLAQLFQQTGQIDSSMQYAKNAIAVAFHGPTDVRVTANKLLAQLLRGKDDKEALKYLFTAIDAKDSNLNATKSLQIQNQLFNEQERQREIAAAVLKAKIDRKHNLQYAGIAIGLITFIILFFALSRSIIVNTRFISFFATLGLLAVFEFINLFIHPYLSRATNDSPVLMLLVLIAIGALLIPLHHKLEKWITNVMTDKNKKIRLSAAKKTIAKLEPISATAPADKGEQIN